MIDIKVVLLTLTYLVGVGELILAWYFWKTNSGNEIRKVMTLLAFSVGVWAILNGLTSYTNPSSAVFLELSFIYVFGIIILNSLLHFSLIFPYRAEVLSSFYLVFLYQPAVIFSYAALFTKTIVQSYTVAPDNPGYVNQGSLFSLYNFYLSLLFVLSLFFLVQKFRRSDGIHRINLKIVIWSLFLGGSPAIIFNLGYVVFGWFINPLVPVVFSGFWLGLTTYILVKK